MLYGPAFHKAEKLLDGLDNPFYSQSFEVQWKLQRLHFSRRRLNLILWNSLHFCTLEKCSISYAVTVTATEMIEEYHQNLFSSILNRCGFLTL